MDYESDEYPPGTNACCCTCRECRKAQPDDVLLWRAFPTGTLPVRGVVTVGGWQCVFAGPSFRLEKGVNVPVRGESHAIWRYMDGWEISEHFWSPRCKAGARWRNRTKADMGRSPEDFCAMGDLLPDLTDPLTWFAVREVAAGRFLVGGPPVPARVSANFHEALSKIAAKRPAPAGPFERP